MPRSTARGPSAALFALLPLLAACGGPPPDDAGTDASADAAALDAAPDVLAGDAGDARADASLPPADVAADRASDTGTDAGTDVLDDAPVDAAPLEPDASDEGPPAFDASDAGSPPPDVAPPPDTGVDAGTPPTSNNHVHISVDNSCNMTVSPLEITIPADQTAYFAWHNHSADFPVDVWNSYGGGYTDLAPGATWNDPIGRCLGPNAHDEYADISTACSSYRFMIHCL